MNNRNIRLLFVIKIAKWLMLYMPIILLFYKENGFSNTELFSLHAIYSFVIAILEVPSGYIADAWGRKPALIAGTFFGVLGFAAYSTGHGFWGFAVAEVLLGVGESLISGADSAILYDTLLEKGKEKSYIRYEGNISAAGNISEAVAGIFVSVVILNYYRYYFFLQTILAFIAFIAALFLYEPVVHSHIRKVGLKDILGIINSSLRENRYLRSILIFSSLIGFSSLVMAWFAQPIFIEAHLSESYFGYAWVILNSFVALGSFLSAKADGLLSFKSMLIYIAVPMSVGFILIGFGNGLFLIISLIVFCFIRGTAHPILKKYINNLTTSDKRATVLSLRSLLIRMMYTTAGPILGYVSDQLSLKFALSLCGITLFIPCIIYVFLILHYKNKSALTAIDN